MNLAHLHLLLNHVPVIAFPICAVLLALALLRRNSDVAKVALGLLAAAGAITIVVYLTGEPAEELVESLAGVSESLIEAHEEAALVATIASGLVGAGALIALLALRGRVVPRRVTWVSLLVTLAAAGTLGWTANLGGQIRHTEIRASGADAPPRGRGDHGG